MSSTAVQYTDRHEWRCSESLVHAASPGTLKMPCWYSAPGAGKAPPRSGQALLSLSPPPTCLDCRLLGARLGPHDSRLQRPALESPSSAAGIGVTCTEMSRVPMEIGCRFPPRSFDLILPKLLALLDTKVFIRIILFDPKNAVSGRAAEPGSTLSGVHGAPESDQGRTVPPYGRQQPQQAMQAATTPQLL